MTIMNEGASPSGGLLARVTNILLHPKTEWARIDAEPATVQGLYVRYICIMAAIPAIAGLIGSLLFVGAISALVPIHFPPAYLITQAIIGYILSLVGVALVALVVEALAPSFGGVKNRIAAFKTVAYSYTAAWVGGILAIFPPLAIIGLLIGLYGFYLLYLGLQEVMKAPKDKAIGYTVVTVIVAIVIGLIMAAIMSSVLNAAFGLSLYGANRFGV